MQMDNISWLTAAMREDAPAAMQADWLTDNEATLADVLHLFAGVPPFWTQGIKKEVLSAWLEAHGDERHTLVAAVTLPLPNVTLAEVTGYNAERACHFAGHFLEGRDHYTSFKITACPVCGKQETGITPVIRLDSRTFDYVNNRLIFSKVCSKCDTLVFMLNDDSIEIIKMKRVVLSHFPKVELPSRVECGCHRGNNTLMRHCSKCGDTGFYFTGALVPADLLIPAHR